jgi:hypothetical protein
MTQTGGANTGGGLQTGTTRTQTGGGTSNVGGGNPTAQTGGAPPAPPAAVAFALNPGVAMGNVVLDYNLKPAKCLYDTTIHVSSLIQRISLISLKRMSRSSLPNCSQACLGWKFHQVGLQSTQKYL